MNISYIYDLKGKPEYAVIPIYFWNKISSMIDNEQEKPQVKTSFEPQKYRGILSNFDLDIDLELSKMRDEWERE